MISTAEPVQNEVAALAELASKRDPEHRAVLYENVISLFEQKHAQLSESQRSLMCDILRRLAHDVEMSVRVELAERLAADDGAPEDVILMLANDEIEVAKPVLLFSRLLNDGDLIDVIYHKTVQHQLAVAARENLGSTVSTALVQVGNDNVVATLLGNASATIPDNVFSGLVDRSETNRHLQAPLVNRKDLPPALAQKMYAWVSDALKETIIANVPGAAEKIEAALAGAIDELSASAKETSGDTTPNTRLVDKLAKAGQLTPAFLVKSLNQGQVELFELGFARMLNLMPARFRKIVYNRGPDALAIACRAVGIDRSAFLSVYRLACRARNMNSELSDAETGHAFNMFDTMDRRMAEIMIHRWAREENQAAVA